MHNDEEMLTEAASSMGAFGVSSGIYWLSIAKPLVLDFALLCVASFLPSKVGIRVGSLAGLLVGPSIASHLSKLDNLDTALPQGFLDAMVFAGTNGKFVFGLLGGLIGSIAFLRFYRQYYLHRFWSNVLASGTTGLAMGAMFGLLLLLLGIGNRHPPPGLMLTLMRMALMDTVISTIAGGFIGLPLAAADLISRRNRYD